MKSVSRRAPTGRFGPAVYPLGRRLPDFLLQCRGIFWMLFNLPVRLCPLPHAGAALAGPPECVAEPTSRLI
jgi:hypothetical protein